MVGPCENPSLRSFDALDAVAMMSFEEARPRVRVRIEPTMVPCVVRVVS